MFIHGIRDEKERAAMLTDTKLRNLKPKDKLYKVNDRDGLYVAITPAGTFFSDTTIQSVAGRRL